MSRKHFKGGNVSMKKHGKSGVPHNPSITMALSRVENERIKAEAMLKEKRKGKMYDSVKELFANKSKHD